jgi:hypothetical protein
MTKRKRKTRNETSAGAPSPKARKSLPPPASGEVTDVVDRAAAAAIIELELEAGAAREVAGERG